MLLTHNQARCRPQRTLPGLADSSAGEWSRHAPSSLLVLLLFLWRRGVTGSTRARAPLSLSLTYGRRCWTRSRYFCGPNSAPCSSAESGSYLCWLEQGQAYRHFSSHFNCSGATWVSAPGRTRLGRQSSDGTSSCSLAACSCHPL